MIWSFLMKVFGWKIDKNFPKDLKRCVLIAVPHTSNWDFLFAMATFKMMKIPIRFTIKKDWVKFPFSLITKPLGAIAINRTPRKEGEQRQSMVEYMTSLYKENKDLVLVVTAEGTRSKVEEWKSGFYHIAQNAGVPIALGYLDYENKIAGIRKELFHPTNNIVEDMKSIMKYYADAKPKINSNFSLDKRYS